MIKVLAILASTVYVGILLLAFGQWCHDKTRHSRFAKWWRAHVVDDHPNHRRYDPYDD